MADQGEQYGKSWLLYHLLERIIGNRETVALNRRLTNVRDQLTTAKRDPETFSTGSRAEGVTFKWSDADIMYIWKNVKVICPDEDTSIPVDSTNETILMMSEANCRPCYVNLKLHHPGQRCNGHVKKSIVQVGDVQFISSEICRRSAAGAIKSGRDGIEMNGPAFTVTNKVSDVLITLDQVLSFPCYDWPSQANEWMNRPRLHNWPDKALRDQIVHGGCHLVPVGDKTSDADQSLQWRISFATAERKLIYSLTHVQLLVYALLKYFKKNLSRMLELCSCEADMISSYIIKTVIFHAVESTPESFWQEKQTFLCYMLCLKILFNWVKIEHCPNYFIKNNNMFLGKVQGKNQQKLLDLLTLLPQMKWNCLSFGDSIKPSIPDTFRNLLKGNLEFLLPSPLQLEYEDDLDMFKMIYYFMNSTDALPVALELLSASTSDSDEFLGYFATVQALSNIGMKTFGEHVTARGNKEKYKSLRKSKNLLRPFATVFTSSGLLSFATFCYQTGNYSKTLEMCGHTMSSFKLHFENAANPTYMDRYKQLYCGRRCDFLHKCQAFMVDIKFLDAAPQFCPSKLDQEIGIPPIPYAEYLSFLCYHELGDTNRRDTSLIKLQKLTSDVDEGGRQHWKVHNLLGMCYETVGDTHGALREYTESLKSQGPDQHQNAVKERIERLQESLT